MSLPYLPTHFRCEEHRQATFPANDDCWRCQLRQELWIAHCGPYCSLTRAERFRAELTNTPTVFRAFILNDSLDSKGLWRALARVSPDPSHYTEERLREHMRFILYWRKKRQAAGIPTE